jgi:hypothetical protein
MILKIVAGNACEVIDGFDRASYREIPPDEVITGSFPTPCWDFTEQQEADADSNPNPKIEIRLYKGSQAINQIISHRPIYLLNNDGKTVERI